MSNLIYAATTSLDGYIEDATGSFAWSQPDDEAHQFINDWIRDIGTHLYGRRLYETMQVWETMPSLAEESDVTADFAQIWQAADKIVYSTTLDQPVTSRTRIERAFDPDALRQMKAEWTSDAVIGGAELAASAFRAGLVDECRLMVVPVIVGGGKRCLPDDVRLELELMDERRFPCGWVYLRYVRKP